VLKEPKYRAYSIEQMKKQIEENKSKVKQIEESKREVQKPAEAEISEDHPQEEVIQGARGNVAGVATNKTINFCFVFGCPPGEGVKGNTKLIEDLTEHLKSTAKDCVVPSVFDMIESEDAGFETVVSNMG